MMKYCIKKRINKKHLLKQWVLFNAKKSTERIDNMLVTVERVNKHEVTVVSRLDVEEIFGKRHADVLRDIAKLSCSKI